MKSKIKVACAIACGLAVAGFPANARVQDDLKGKDVPGYTVDVPDMKTCFGAAGKLVAQVGTALVECRYADGKTELYRCDDRTTETMFGEPTDRFANPAPKAGFHCLKVI